MIQHAAGTYGPLVGMGVAGTVAKSALPNVFRGIDRLKAAPTQYLQRVMPSKGANPMARLGKLGLPGVAGSPATAAAFHPTNLPLEPSMLR